ncbi:MAG: 50S ribosomal protein L24 [Candidatus Coatesbacteria bacterium]
MEHTPASHVRKGDFVQVLGGKDRGKTGRVLLVYPDRGTAVVEKIAVVKRHSRPTQKNPQGGIVSKEREVPSSRLMVVCMRCHRPTRHKRTVLATGQKVRVCRHCNEPLDKV